MTKTCIKLGRPRPIRHTWCYDFGIDGFGVVRTKTDVSLSCGLQGIWRIITWVVHVFLYSFPGIQTWGEASCHGRLSSYVLLCEIADTLRARAIEGVGYDQRTELATTDNGNTVICSTLRNVIGAMDKPITAYILGTAGAICWSIQLIPQIITNYRCHNATGLQPMMMMLWAVAGLPLGMYNIGNEYNMALRIQPQLLAGLSLLT